MIAATCLAALPRYRDADTDLMLRLQRGDGSAFAPLLERNHERVLSLAYRYTGDPNQAEEIAQETFLRVYEARHRYQPKCPFGAYLTRIATNLCISRARRVSARRTFTMSTCTEEAADAPPIQGLLRDEVRARVRAAVQRLPERQRMAIVLQRFEGQSYEQVADGLGLTVPATKSLLHRARTSLKTMLQDLAA